MALSSETLTQREPLAKYDRQRVRFKGVIESFRSVGRNRVIVCVTDVSVNELKLRHIWLNFQREWFSARFERITFGKTHITGTAEVSSYRRRPKLLAGDAGNLLIAKAESFDYGLSQPKKIEIEGIED